MILTNAVKDFETNVNLESKQFTIGDTNKVIDLLISQYKYPIRTLVQEYICNAIDASKEKDLNFDVSTIKVELPNHFNKMMFSVRDFGVGLSHDRIHQVFCVMGASTKSKDNNQIGGFGLGAKSALAYTDHFFIASFLDGIRTDYLVRKAPHGGIVLDTLGNEPTTEENGTLIQVKAKDSKDIAKFNQAYDRLTLFWDIKPSCANNKEVKKVKISNILTLSDQEVIGKEYSENLWINLGGVLYAVKGENVAGSNAKTTIVTIPVGAIMPLQTRESLNFEDKKTQAVIEKYCEQASKDLFDHVASFKGKTFKESFDGLSRLSRLVCGSVQLKEVLAILTYKELSFDIPVKTYTRKAERYSSYGRSKRTANIKTSTGKELDLSDISSIMEMDVTPKNVRLHSFLASNDYAIEIEDPKHLELIKQVKSVKKLSDVVYTVEPKVKTETKSKVFAKIGKSAYDTWINIDEMDSKSCYAIDYADRRLLEAVEHLGYTVYTVKQVYVKRLQSAGIPTLSEVVGQLQIDKKQLAISKASKKFYDCGLSDSAKHLKELITDKHKVEFFDMILNRKGFHEILFNQVDNDDYKRALKRLYKLSQVDVSYKDKNSDKLRKFIKAMRGE
jgi:WD40 repeat protein